MDDDRKAGEGVGVATWADLFAEVRAFEAWYAPTRMAVNAWIGVDTASDGFYGGFHVEGDRLVDDWDEEAVAASGVTVEACIAELIRLGRAYRARRDAERAELAAEDVPASRR